MNKNQKVAIILFVLFSGASLYAGDFGVVLNQTAGFGGYEDNSDFDYSGTLIPRWSTMLGDNMGVYVSIGLGYDTSVKAFVPELLRTDFSWNFGMGNLVAGRMYYADPLGFVATGLFDGAQVSFDTAAGSLSAGAWYTGLLYKKRANITMTDDELVSYGEELDYSNFLDTYFAPGRFVAALGWEHPSVAELFGARADLIGQFDLSGGDLHSQYLAVKLTMPVKRFVIDLGGVLELIETDGDMKTALAGEVGFSWMPDVLMEQQLSFLGRFTSGVSEDGGIYAFQPLTTASQGSILQGRLSGLSMISLAYTARILQELSASVSSSYFVRSDLGSYRAYPVLEGSKGYFLGNEFYGKLYWGPIPDVLVTLGGGVFLPSLGDVVPKIGSSWRIEVNVILSLY